MQERDGWADCVYLDLKKLKHNGGLRGGLLRWMENFLTSREMRTVVKDQKIIMEGSHKWSTPRLGTCTNHVYSLYK